jgi:hypothetical protein
MLHQTSLAIKASLHQTSLTGPAMIQLEAMLHQTSLTVKFYALACRM